MQIWNYIAILYKVNSIVSIVNLVPKIEKWFMKKLMQIFALRNARETVFHINALVYS